MKTSRSALQNCAQALAVTGLALGLHLDSSAQPIAPPPGMIAWWPGDGNANDIFSTNNGVLLGGATASGGGKVNLALQFNGGGGYVEVPDSPSLDFPGSMTVEFWINVYVPLEGQCSWVQFMAKQDGSQHGWTIGAEANQGTLAFTGRDAADTWFGVATTQTGLLPRYQFAHVAATYEQSTGRMVIYVNGVIKAQGYVGTHRIAKVSQPFRIGANNDPPYACFNGAIDEVSLYNRALSLNEVWAIYAAGAAGKRKDPLITQHPQSQEGYWGRSVTLTTTAKGTQPLRYQWRKNGVPLAGATSSALTLSNLQATNSGAYTVTVTNTLGAVTTYPAQLSVSPVEMSFSLYAGVFMKGVVGQTYGVQTTTDLSNTNSWIGLTNLLLTTPTYLWYDSQSATQLHRYYRVLPGPIPVP